MHARLRAAAGVRSCEPCSQLMVDPLVCPLPETGVCSAADGVSRETVRGPGPSRVATPMGRAGPLHGRPAVATAIPVVGWASAWPAVRAARHGFGPLELGAVRLPIAAVPAAIWL